MSEYLVKMNCRRCKEVRDFTKTGEGAMKSGLKYEKLQCSICKLGAIRVMKKAVPF